ncbi:uncharacterized protein F4822DRAFT_424531 [Hypoxylon trugodes]|uniref:uncharacterized protein n=1 Tax=Hypoxylon trugodes TaxID=326681 RepID=UPI0021A0B6A0|nr:uncharacterized protein F4822DRAFT_424531 [Hypoxylon trugodes]KAI1394065.1 hypothetical protein F4822DRAFT_424531 [Hypoxylon trugodes]
MAVFNPFQIFIFPFLFLVALPLALCAGFTTILAFMVLFLRLFLVYFDVGLETLRYVLVGHAAHNRYISQRTDSVTPPSSSGSSPPSSPEARHRYRRKRQSSVSSGSVTPVGGLDGFTLTPSIGLERDFEGVGGWRLDSVDVGANATDNQQWYNLNSRLEITDRRHHFRSQSGGGVLAGASGLGLYMKGQNTQNTGTAYSPEGIRMHASPNSSRSRTPTNGRPRGFTKLDDDEYFPALNGRHAKAVQC